MSAHDSDDGPLRPVYNPCRPPWIGYWNKRWENRDKYVFI
ncbi:unnamed protein product [Gongylonema pulchrum]|uniref:PH domain-containing protein n=1 Tax=Gongylonema pulchrum TaxID=637853 RepID=A0A183EYX8_9BILA|nr:unnamed protein product [Gongylonema pulchrum]